MWTASRTKIRFKIFRKGATGTKCWPQAAGDDEESDGSLPHGIADENEGEDPSEVPQTELEGSLPQGIAEDAGGSTCASVDEEAVDHLLDDQDDVLENVISDGTEGVEPFVLQNCTDEDGDECGRGSGGLHDRDLRAEEEEAPEEVGQDEGSQLDCEEADQAHPSPPSLVEDSMDIHDAEEEGPSPQHDLSDDDHLAVRGDPVERLDSEGSEPELKWVATGTACPPMMK